MNFKELHINQVFKSIQCEGPKIGTPSLFIRMQYCNLCCNWCDTKYALNDDKHIIISTNDELKDFLDTIDMESEVVKNLVITGGEPLLYAKNALFQDILFDVVGSWNSIEIETNGMIITEKIINNLLSITSPSEQTTLTLNISPKLDTTCYKSPTTFDDIVGHFKKKIKLITNVDHVWKFVYTPSSDHILKFIDKLRAYDDFGNVWIMPLTPERNSKDFDKKFRDSCLKTVNFCIDNGFMYSPREHIWLFNSNEIDEIEKIL